MVTVLGGSGFVGGHLVAKLRDDNVSFVAPARGDQSIFQRHLGHVIYCIGLTGDFRQRQGEAIEAHVCYLKDVLLGCEYESLLYLSSTRVYSRSTMTDEDAPLCVLPQAPDDLFNISKLAGEAICLSTSNPRVRIARVSNVFGVGMSPAFLPSIIADAQERGQVTLQSALTSAKDYIAVDDVVDLLVKISAGGRHSIYNVASGSNVTHLELTEELKRLTGCAVHVAPNAGVTLFPPISTERIRTEFGFKASTRVTDYLKTTAKGSRSVAANDERKSSERRR